MLTIGITTWQRPDSLRRLLRSIRTHLRGWPRVVEDTEGNLSRGRNRMFAKVQTEWLLLLEDDMEIDERFSLDLLIDVARFDPEMAVVGCGLDNPPGIIQTWAHDFERFRGQIRYQPSRRPLRVTRQGVRYQPCQFLANVGLFKVAVCRGTPWDEQLPLCEHREWFFRLAQTEQWRCACVEGCMVKHYRDRPTEAYKESRNRSFTDHANKKHNAIFVAGAKDYEWSTA
jgi:hypothetical protein